MFLDAIGDCNKCDRRAFFEHQDRKCCVRHSSAINGVDPDEVERIAKDLEDIDGVEMAEPWPIAFIVVVPSGDELPWTVHDVSDEHGYRVSGEEFDVPDQFILEPRGATVPYRDVAKFLGNH